MKLAILRKNPQESADDSATIVVKVKSSDFRGFRLHIVPLWKLFLSREKESLVARRSALQAELSKVDAALAQNKKDAEEFYKADSADLWDAWIESGCRLPNIPESDQVKVVKD